MCTKRSYLIIRFTKIRMYLNTNEHVFHIFHETKQFYLKTKHKFLLLMILKFKDLYIKNIYIIVTVSKKK